VSRIGKAPIPIPEGVTVDIKKNQVTIKGPKGELGLKVDPVISLKLEDGTLTVNRPSDHRQHRSYHGLYRALLANNVTGVLKGFEKDLEIIGVGYRVELKDKAAIFSLGFSHSIVMVPPKGVDIVVKTPTEFTVTGIDKQLVGMVAAKIRSFRPPEPYKGKGIRYKDEVVRRKAGKSAA